MENLFMISYFYRRHDKKVDLKEFEKSTVTTLLIPKHLVDKLELVIPYVENSNTKKKSYKFKDGLKKLLEKYKGMLAHMGICRFNRSRSLHIPIAKSIFPFYKS